MILINMKYMKAVLYWDIFMEKERRYVQINLNMKGNGRKIKEKDKED